MKKTFILDTNVLLHDVNCLHAFEDNDIIIPMAVIEELDAFKSEGDTRGKNARIATQEHHSCCMSRPSVQSRQAESHATHCR